MNTGEVATGQGSGETMEDVARLFAGPGELRARCRALDWAATPLGPVDGWPQSLRTAVGLCLASGFPMLVMWGPELVQIYNDAFRSVLQAKHPAGLGKRARDCSPELWATIGPMFQGVLDTGAPIFLEDQLFTPERQGEPGVTEEAYFTFSYSAIPDEAHRSAGILATVFETTRHVLSRGERERALERANIELRSAAAEGERLLVESEAARARVTAALESIGDAFYAIDADFRFTYVNRRAEALWGRSRETLLGRHYWSEFPQAVGSEAYQQHVAAMRERRPAHFEAVSPIIGRWVDVSLYPDPVGGGLACYFRDVTDRKAAEAALRESEARFRLMADAVPQIVWTTDGQGRTEFFNRQWTAYTGAVFEPGTAAQIAADFVHPDDAAVTVERFEEARRTGAVFEVEHRIRSAAGRYRWFLVRAEPLRDRETGEITRWVGASVDIHDRRQAAAERERLLAETEAARAAADLERRRLLTVLEQLPVGVHVAEAPSGRLVLDNAAIRSIFGEAPRSEQVADYGADYAGHYPPGHPQAGEPLASDAWPLARTLASGAPAGEELVEIRRADGTRRLASVSAAPVHDAEGRVVGAVATSVDVTDRERLRARERTARERAERLQALTAALAATRTPEEVAATAVLHTAAALGAVGAVVARLAEDDGTLEILQAGDMPDATRAVWRRFPLSVSAPLADAARTGEPVYLASREEWASRYPHLIPTLDATGHQANAVMPLVLDGRVLGVIGAAFTDPRLFDPEDRALALAVAQQCAQAFDRARLFEAERAARHEAEAANRAKSEFLAVMSHELRTPLNAIGGYAELMEMGIRGPVTAQQREDLRRMQASQRHLLGLINEVLNYAKLETGAVQYDLTSVRALDALAGAEALVAPQAQAKGLTLAVAECPAHFAVRADAEKLRQILVNLLSNAVKFTDHGGRITLACVESGDHLRVTVRDTGIGIAADQLERIFDPFVQVRADLTRPHDGAGLGLAISRDLARGMGGELSVESTSGMGSAFTLTLPRA